LYTTTTTTSTMLPPRSWILFRRYLLHRLSYSEFCAKFRCHNGVGRGKIQLAAFNGLSTTPPPIDAKISQISFTQTEI